MELYKTRILEKYKDSIVEDLEPQIIVGNLTFLTHAEKVSLENEVSSFV